MDLSGKAVAITGATSGIGEATALLVARSGGSVALAGRRADRLEALAARITDEGGRAVALPTDVAKEDEARAFVAQAAEQLGRLDALVNNAGVMLLGPVTGADTAEWRRMIEVNCLGLLYCTHAALPLMGEGGGGHIVNVSSVAGRRASLGAAVYNMTKFGVTGFSEALRQEALHAGIRVTVVEPGYVETELQGHNTNPVVVDTMEKMRAQIGEPLQADDIAQAIVYALASPSTSTCPRCSSCRGDSAARTQKGGESARPQGSAEHDRRRLHHPRRRGRRRDPRVPRRQPRRRRLRADHRRLRQGRAAAHGDEVPRPRARRRRAPRRVGPGPHRAGPRCRRRRLGRRSAPADRGAQRPAGRPRPHPRVRARRDDYVCKPFAYAELRARVAALLRRAQQRPGLGRVRVGSLEIDPVARVVTLGGERVELSQKEYALLRTLAAEPVRVFTKDELLRQVWGYRASGITRTLDSHACRLRQKLGVRGDAFVVNVWGVGYRLVDGPVAG
jgi:NADP-dependent 3-hydroxy acid dehydrogenase YdfG